MTGILSTPQNLLMYIIAYIHTYIVYDMNIGCVVRYFVADVMDLRYHAELLRLFSDAIRTSAIKRQDEEICQSASVISSLREISSLIYLNRTDILNNILLLAIQIPHPSDLQFSACVSVQNSRIARTSS